MNHVRSFLEECFTTYNDNHRIVNVIYAIFICNRLGDKAIINNLKDMFVLPFSSQTGLLPQSTVSGNSHLQVPGSSTNSQSFGQNVLTSS